MTRQVTIKLELSPKTLLWHATTDTFVFKGSEMSFTCPGETAEAALAELFDLMARILKGQG